MTVEYICEGGHCSEATVEIQLRTESPGIGGTIFTYQAIPVAWRKEHHASPDIGHKSFFAHAVPKKLEDYFFFPKGVYRYAHLTRPLGSCNEGYIYKWAFGSDGFPWFYTDPEGRLNPLQLDDWHEFIEAFANARIDMTIDCNDPDDGRISKNIVHELMRPYAYYTQLNRIWKRVDFGDRSIQSERPPRYSKAG